MVVVVVVVVVVLNKDTNNAGVRQKKGTRTLCIHLMLSFASPPSTGGDTYFLDFPLQGWLCSTVRIYQ